MIPRCRYTALALSAILIPATSFGWGRDAHRIIGQMAEQFLSTKARHTPPSWGGVRLGLTLEA